MLFEIDHAVGGRLRLTFAPNASCGRFVEFRDPPGERRRQAYAVPTWYWLCAAPVAPSDRGGSPGRRQTPLRAGQHVVYVIQTRI